mmetsp:Transcript_17813/g.51014  ORF Transcript_17813/g.51014 Transcript_17813/m.51014 type:complete len:130 (-) Transcript_17813:105-494(-)
MDSIKQRQRLVQDAISAVQEQLFALENRYLEETSATGNVVRGWEGYIDSRPRSTMASKKERRAKASERIFSFSSVTSPIPSEELARELSTNVSPVNKLRRKSSIATDGQERRGARKKTKRKRQDDDPDF